MQRNTIFSSPLRSKQPHNEELITLKCPKTPLYALGAPPRLSYPLVIFLTREFDSDDHLHPNEAVSEIRRCWQGTKVKFCPLDTQSRSGECQWVSYNLRCLDNTMTTYQQKCKKNSFHFSTLKVPVQRYRLV